MKNYNDNVEVPSAIVKCNVKQICGFSFYNPIPILEVGRVYYGNVIDRRTGNKYNVVRFKGIFIDMAKDYSVEAPVAVFMFDTPKGKTITARYLKQFFDLFKSKSSYIEYLTSGNAGESITSGPLSTHRNSTDLFIRFFEEYGRNRVLTSYHDYYEVQGYMWNGNNGRPELYPARIKYAWVDENGAHVIFDDDKKMYKERTDCVKDNFILDEDFPDLPKERQTFKVNLTISIEAETLEEAEESAREKLAGLM